jgi:ABC-type antimicrobial peptide transport system permease subunit
MRWTDAVGLAVRGVSRRRGRALLTVMAVALAATLLTALLAMASTAKSRVLGQLTQGGPLAGIRIADVGGTLDDAALETVRELPDVAAASPVLVLRQAVMPVMEAGPAHPFLDGVVGVDLSRADLLPVTVLAGRLPAPGSRTGVAVTESFLHRVGLDRDNPLPVLGTGLELGVRDGVLGSTTVASMRWSRAVVVGVIIQEAGAGGILAPIEPVLAAQAFADPTARRPRYTALLVEARGLSGVGPARDQLAAAGFASDAPENLIATVERYLHVLEMVLTAIGSIALVIAALGIANALMAAVRERRREIGVLKAIGARDRDVRRIFLLEASLLGLCGGLVGTVAGWGLAHALTVWVSRYLMEHGLAGVSMGLPISILLLGVTGSTTLALVAGVAPAARAARLPAREAMGGA